VRKFNKIENSSSEAKYVQKYKQVQKHKHKQMQKKKNMRKNKLCVQS